MVPFSHRCANRYANVVITGIGPFLPGVTDSAGLWLSLREGTTHLQTFPKDIREATGIHAGGRICRKTQYPQVPHLPERHAAKYSYEILAVLAALQAARADAGLEDHSVAPERIGIIGSSSRGPVEWLTTRQSGDAIFSSLPGSPVTMSAILVGAKGLVTTLSNACVGGNQALLIAADQIELERADVMFVIGYDFPLVPRITSIYTSPKTRVISRCEDGPRAVKPYDRDRDGFLLGESAVVLVLERTGHAIGRGARAYASLRAGISLNEAAHATRMDVTGATTAATLSAVLKQGGITPRSLDYVCGHGTATYYNDLTESRALRELFGPRRTEWPPLGSVKPNFGHLLGAAGILNAAASALMLQHQTLAPTINIINPEPECDHDHVKEGSRETSLENVATLAFAIGSQSSALLLGAA